MSTDLIDIVKEKTADCPKEEDPRFYQSQKSGRGPLTDDWLKNLKDDPGCKKMCAYKICKVC